MRLTPFLILAFRQILNGALWAVGSAVITTLLNTHKKGTSVLARSRLLFHPNVTRIAVLSSTLLNLSGFLMAIGSASGALHGVFRDKADAVGGTCILLGIACAQIAGWGRSTVSAVDNNQPPQ